MFKAIAGTGASFRSHALSIPYTPMTKNGFLRKGLNNASAISTLREATLEVDVRDVCSQERLFHRLLTETEAMITSP